MVDKLRITGLATGLDIDSLVKQAIKAENIKLDKVKQDRQLVQWKQDLYREIIGDLNTFKSTYYDVLKSDSYMLSANNYAAFDTSNTVSTTNSIVTASAGAGAAAGTYNLKNITIATKASLTSNSIMKVKEAGGAISFSVKSTDITNSKYDSITIKLNGENYKIKLAGSYTNLDSLANEINNKLKTADKHGVKADISSMLRASVSADGTSIKFIPESENTLEQILKSDNTVLAENKMNFDINIEEGINDKLTININGTSVKDITFAGKYSSLTDLVTAINTELNDAGIGDSTHGSKLQAKVSLDGTRIEFVNQSNDDQINIKSNSLSSLGFTTAVDVYPSTSNRMASLFSSNDDAKVSFTINNTSFTYDFSSSGSDRDKTISEVINEVSSKAGVNISYSELGRKFSIESNSTGSTEKLSASESSGKFLYTLLGTSSIDKTGSDAKVTITDSKGYSSTVIKSSNTFTIDGMTYNLLKDDSNVSGIDITVTSNTQKVYDKVKAFIDKYNECIEKIQDNINKKKQYSYKPLTDDQKKEMKEDEIKAWEAKAKEGILQSDASLQNMIFALRRAFFDKVEGAGITLSEIGLTTESNYNKGGKIVINEVQLKKAIQNRGDQVMNLFMKKSTIDYDPDHKNDNDRYKEIGIFQRVNDILKDYTRTTRNTNGKKGILIEKAGIKGDLSEIENMLSKDMKDNYDKRISDLTKKLVDKENKYYLQYSKLEVAIQKMNEQSNWLAQQFASGK